MLTPREKSPLPENFPEEDRTCDAVDSEPNTTNELFQPPLTLYCQLPGRVTTKVQTV